MSFVRGTDGEAGRTASGVVEHHRNVRGIQQAPNLRDKASKALNARNCDARSQCASYARGRGCETQVVTVEMAASLQNHKERPKRLLTCTRERKKPITAPTLSPSLFLSGGIAW